MTQTRDVNALDLTGASNYLEAFVRRFWEGDISETYHENTKLNGERLRTYEDTRDRLETPGLRLSRYAMAHDYRDAERVDLPPPADLDVDLQTALGGASRGSESPPGGLNVDALSTLLYHACGVEESDARALSERGSDDRRVEVPVLRYPSPSESYPNEHYLLIDDVRELDAGIYYYVPTHHSLRVLDTTIDVSAAVRDVFVDGVAEDAAIVHVAAAVFWRTKLLYGPRGYRAALQESGHVLQNLRLVAGGLGLRGEPMWQFRDDELNQLLSIDGTTEAAVHALAIGT